MKRALVAAMFLSAVSGSGAQAPPDTDRDALREASRRLSRQLRRSFEDPGLAPWNLAALAQKLDQDPEKIRAFVAKLRYEPYPGFQRGPVGVLASGAGNASDRAFLAAELLRRSGREARVLRGTIDAKKAAELLAAPPAAAPAAPDPAAFAAACEEAGLDPAVAGGMMKASAERRRRRFDEAVRLADRETAFLRGRLEGVKPPPPRGLAREIAEWARAHAWVEWRGPGQDDWTPMDPCFDALPAGIRGEVVDVEAVADSISLTFRMERSVDGRSESVNLLVYTVPVHRMLLEPVRFAVRPSGRYSPPEKPEERAKALKALRRFQAEIRIGPERFGSKVFDFDGNVMDVGLDGSLIGTKEKVAGAIELFKGLGGEPKKEDPKKKGELKSLGVTLEAWRGDKSLWKQERTILAEGERDSVSPLLEWNLYAQAQDPGDGFARGMHARHAVRNEALMERVQDWVQAGSPKDGIDALAEIPAYYYPLTLLDFARARRAYVRRLGPSFALLREAPELFIEGRQLRFKDGGAAVCSCTGMDLVENGAIVVDEADGRSLRRDATAALGVFDTALEQVQVGWANESEASGGTIAVFERERCLGKNDFTLAGSNDRAALEKSGLPKSDVDWIRRNTRPGRQILAAASTASHCASIGAWWELEPATGRTIGRISGGLGGCVAAGPSAETIKLFTFVASVSFCFAQLFENMHDRHPGILNGLQFAACLGGAAVGMGDHAGLGLALVMASGLMDRLQFFFGDPE